MCKFHDTTTHMRTHTHDHRLQSDINTILIITNQLEITITIITISSVDTQQVRTYVGTIIQIHFFFCNR